jgi:hypothetical protein
VVDIGEELKGLIVRLSMQKTLRYLLLRNSIGVMRVSTACIRKAHRHPQNAPLCAYGSPFIMLRRILFLIRANSPRDGYPC